MTASELVTDIIIKIYYTAQTSPELSRHSYAYYHEFNTFSLYGLPLPYTSQLLAKVIISKYI
ncbi:hypothetical protein DSUL_160084 [Desulfovibrionales bacterium]